MTKSQVFTYACFSRTVNILTLRAQDVTRGAPHTFMREGSRYSEQKNILQRYIFLYSLRRDADWKIELIVPTTCKGEGMGVRGRGRGWDESKGETEAGSVNEQRKGRRERRLFCLHNNFNYMHHNTSLKDFFMISGYNIVTLFMYVCSFMYFIYLSFFKDKRHYLK